MPHPRTRQAPVRERETLPVGKETEGSRLPPASQKRMAVLPSAAAAATCRRGGRGQQRQQQ